jgi:hypothetical protein
LPWRPSLACSDGRLGVACLLHLGQDWG